MILILPLFLLLAGAVIVFVYMTFQGLKVQQAANLAARIQAQERVGGGTTIGDITLTNEGPRGTQDENPLDANGRPKSQPTPPALNPPRPRSVYSNFREAVRSMFSEGEKEKLWVPAAKEGLNIDQVTVVRVLDVPSFFGVNLGKVALSATAYGGEDTHMYGLKRWSGATNGNGRPVGNGTPFWQGAVRGAAPRPPGARPSEGDY